MFTLRRGIVLWHMGRRYLKEKGWGGNIISLGRRHDNGDFGCFRIGDIRLLLAEKLIPVEYICI